jgi:hypothetical protein
VPDDELRAYLLGRMPADEAARLEERLLEDDDLFGTARSVEDDLFDAHARGRLNPLEQQQFLARYGDQTARIAFARALAARTGASPVRLKADTTYAWMPLAAAAVLVLAVGGYLLVRQQTPRVATQTAAISTVARTPAVAVAMLTLGTSRAPGAPLAVTLPTDASALRLHIVINPADRFDRYALDLRSTADRIVWHGDDLHASSDASELSLIVDVPAGSLENGTYEVAVRGVNGGAPAEALGFVTVEVHRAP